MRLTSDTPAVPAADVRELAPSSDRGRGQRSQEDPWVEVLRGAIEADLSNSEEIDGERQQARALRGALRFLTYLASATNSHEVAEAAIQAAAIWFDADARVYRRRPVGIEHRYALVASLPGAERVPETRELPDLIANVEPPFARLSSLPGVTGGREAVLVPLTSLTGAGDQSEWLLVLLGTVPAEADVTLEALGRVLGLQMERLALERGAAARVRFEQVLVRAERPVELTALDLLRDLVGQTKGQRAALWVQHGPELRRMAAVGASSSLASPLSVLPDEHRSDGDCQVRTLALGPHRRARLEVGALDVEGQGEPFEAEVSLVVDACASVLRSWLPVAVGQTPFGSSPSSSVVTDFARRLEEELARAKRFDRDLAVLVVESGVLAWPRETVDRLVDVLRGELRGSDVMGLVGERRVVVLLIETHESGIGTVVQRLRRRLSQAIPELKLCRRWCSGRPRSQRDCATAEALLSRAVFNAETDAGDEPAADGWPRRWAG